ncbi:MAG: DMT family transporter [bacterium]|nr:DMT family transporter [bacterium]
MKKLSQTRIIILAIVACLLWSTAFVGVKVGLKYTTPLFFAGTRFMIAGLILLPFCGRISNYFKTVRSNFKMILLLSVFQTFILYGILYFSMTLAPGALVAIVIGSSPLITAIMSHFLMHDDTMTLNKLSALLVGMGGVVFLAISRKPWTSGGFKEFIALAFLLVGSISSAFGNILVAKDKNKINPLILNSSQIFIGGFLLFMLSLPLEGVQTIIYPAEFYAALAWLSFLSAAAFSLWFYLLKVPGVKVSELNVWKFIIPVFGAALSWLLLPDETPEWMSVLGMICVASSIILFNFRVTGKEKRPEL